MQARGVLMQKQKIRPAGQERIKKPAQSGTRGYTVKNTITFGNDSALVSLRNLCFDNTADVLAHDARFTPSHPQTQYAFKTVVFCKTNRLQ